jgi:rSAM/selenodomain-associated transferase 1
MPILGLKNTPNPGKDADVFHYPTSKNALIIFTRNPELGKCKTRLAATVGDEAALNIYTFLVHHTVDITTPLNADKFVYYSVKKRMEDCWDNANYRKHLQQGDDLGIRMKNAFAEVFEMGYEKAIIIGSDMYDMNTSELQNAFLQLAKNDAVIGPAVDGGYYLLGMKGKHTPVFENKTWGTNTVLENTLKDLQHLKVALLEEKNDVDYYDDIKEVAAFQEFLPEEWRTQ